MLIVHINVLCLLTLHIPIKLFPFSGSAETLLKKNAEPILHIAGLDVTIVKVIDFSLILTSYTLQNKKLVCIFSILFFTHSLRC